MMGDLREREKHQESERPRKDTRKERETKRGEDDERGERRGVMGGLREGSPPPQDHP